MATLYQKQRSPHWWMRFQHNGVRYQESTGKDNKNAAKKVMANRISEIKGSGSYTDLFVRLKEEIGNQPLDKQDRIRQELAKELLSDTLEKLLLSDAFALYKSKPKKRNPSEQTIKQYEGYWKRFIKWLDDKHPGTQYLHEITPRMADQYMTYLWGTNVAEGTYNRNLIFLRCLFNLVQGNAGLSDNVWKNIDKLQVSSVSKKMLTPDQLENVVEEAKGEMKILFLIGLYTGLRLGDAAMLRWDEIIDLGTEYARIVKIPNKTKKLQKPVNIPLHNILHAVLIASKEQADVNAVYVLPELSDLYTRNGSNISRPIQDVFTNAGITTTESVEGKRGKRVTVLYGFHSLRHSFVSLCAANKVPQIVVMELVGHNSSAVHAIYQHTTDELKRNAITTLPDVTKKKLKPGL